MTVDEDRRRFRATEVPGEASQGASAGLVSSDVTVQVRRPGGVSGTNSQSTSPSVPIGVEGMEMIPTITSRLSSGRPSRKTSGAESDSAIPDLSPTCCSTDEGAWPSGYKGWSAASSKIDSTGQSAESSKTSCCAVSSEISMKRSPSLNSEIEENGGSAEACLAGEAPLPFKPDP